MDKITIKGALSRRRSEEAKRLTALLEMDDFQAMADDPVDAPADSAETSAADDVKASADAMILAVVHGDGDNKAKLKKIAKILDVESELTMTEMDEEPEGEEEVTEMDDEKKDEEMAESVKKLERRDKARDLCEAAGVCYSEIPKAARAALDGAETEADAKELIEAFKPKQPEQETETKERPHIRSVLHESNQGRGNGDGVESVKDCFVKP